MPRAIGHELDQRLVPAGQLDDLPDHGQVVALVRPTAVVDLARRSVLERVTDPAREVLHEQPVPHVLPIPVHRQAVARQRVQDHQRDQLLRVLVRSVVVRAATDHASPTRTCGSSSKRADPRRSSSRCKDSRAASGDASVNEPVSIDPYTSSVDTCKYAQPPLARRFEQNVRALHVGHDEFLGPGDRPIDVRLGREVHHRLTPDDRLCHRGRILDRSLQEPNIRLDLPQVLPPSRVRQLVEHRHLVAMHAHPLAHERRPDEPGATADQQLHLALTARVNARYSARPCRQSGRTGRVAFAAKHAVRRSRRGSGHIGCGASSHFTANARSGHDFTRELEPRAGPTAGDVQDSDRRRLASSYADERLREVPGERRAPDLVVDHLELVPFRRESQDRRREARTAHTEQPRGPHDRVALGRFRRHPALAGQLRAAVRGHRPDHVGFHVRRSLGAVEHVVARDVDRPCAARARSARHVAGAGGVHRLGPVLVPLGAIDVGPCGAIDHDVRAGAADRLRHHRAVGDVELGARQRKHIVAGAPRRCG